MKEGQTFMQAIVLVKHTCNVSAIIFRRILFALFHSHKYAIIKSKAKPKCSSIGGILSSICLLFMAVLTAVLDIET